MNDYWPKSGENLSDYIANKKKETAVQTLENCVSQHPELTLSLMKKLEKNKGALGNLNLVETTPEAEYDTQVSSGFLSRRRTT
jgi:hypothetical protein